MIKISVRNVITRSLLMVGISLLCFSFQGTLWADEGSDEKIVIPATANAIWKEIDQHTSEIDHLIKTDKLTEIHHHAAAIRDLVNALPSHSSSLSADKLADVKSNVSYVATLAQRLDESGDAKDKSSSIDNLTKLKKLLTTIRSNYPTSPPMQKETTTGQ